MTNEAKYVKMKKIINFKFYKKSVRDKLLVTV